jgi:hypothetical protein
MFEDIKNSRFSLACKSAGAANAPPSRQVSAANGSDYVQDLIRYFDTFEEQVDGHYDPFPVTSWEGSGEGEASTDEKHDDPIVSGAPVALNFNMSRIERAIDRPFDVNGDLDVKERQRRIDELTTMK